MTIDFILQALLGFRCIVFLESETRQLRSVQWGPIITSALEIISLAAVIVM